MIEELLQILVKNDDIQTGENIAEDSENLSVSLMKKLLIYLCVGVIYLSLL